MSFSKSSFENPDCKNDEIKELWKENSFLKNQIEMLKIENKRQLEIHCKERDVLKQNLFEVQSRLVKERKMFKSDIFELSYQLEALKQSVNKMLEIRSQYSDLDLTWDNFIEIKSQEIEKLKEEILELQLALKNTANQEKSSRFNTPTKSPIFEKDTLESNPYSEKLRDIFFRYATVFSYNEIHIDLTHFKLIFTELGLGGKEVSWKQAEVLYYSVSQRSNIDFEKFIKILKKITWQRFKSKDLNKILNLLKIPEKRIDTIDKNLRFWIEEACSGSVREVIDGYEEILRIIYVVYGSKDVKNQNKLGLMNLLEFCVDCKIIPEFVSKLEVSRIFRAVEYGESLGYEEFLTVFASICILGMGKHGIQNTADAVARLLEVISENSEFIYTKKNQSNRWGIEI